MPSQKELSNDNKNVSVVHLGPVGSQKEIIIQFFTNAISCLESSYRRNNKWRVIIKSLSEEEESKKMERIYGRVGYLCPNMYTLTEYRCRKDDSNTFSRRTKAGLTSHVEPMCEQGDGFLKTIMINWCQRCGVQP